MRVTLIDLMRAVDDLETLKRKVFDDFAPLWDADEAMMVRALAVLHQLVKDGQEARP